METLEQIIIRETNFTHGELRQAQFAHPDVGLIEAVRRSMGDSKGSELLALVSKKLAVPQLDLGGLVVDEHLIAKGGEELQRLIFAFRAVPLNFFGNDEKKKVRLAMCDPADRLAKKIFSTYFGGATVMPCAAPEKELFQALSDAIAACPPGSDFRKQASEQRIAQPDLPGSAEVEKAIKLMFTEAINNAAREIELEFKDNFTKAIIGLPLDMVKTIDLPVAPEELVSSLLARSDLQQTQRAVFEGTCHLVIDSAVIDTQIEFHEFHKNRSGTQGKCLILSNMTVNAPNRSTFWFSQPPAAVQTFDKALANSAGLFICAFPNDFLRQTTVAGLQRRYPDLCLVPDLQSLAKDPSIPSRVKHSRVLVALPGNGLAAALKQLDPVPPNVRNLVRAILAYTRVPRMCYYCMEQCKPTTESLALFPEQYRSQIELLRYPRGCQVCNKEGYAGSIGLAALLTMESDAGKAFIAGKASGEVLPMLRPAGVVSILETALGTVLAGSTSIEILAKTLLGKSDIPPQQFSTIGKQIVRDGKVVATGSERKDKSPLDGSKPKTGSSMADFHSVVLEMDDDFLSMREQLMDEEGDDDTGEAW